MKFNFTVYASEILTRKVIGMDLILYKLAQSVLVDVYPSGLTVMDLALDHRRVGSRLHLEARYSIVVNVILFKISL